MAWFIHGGWVLFPQSFLVSQGEGPAQMLRMKRRKKRKSGRRKKAEETERLTEGEENESGRTRSKGGR